MKYKVGIFGSAADVAEKVIPKVVKLGEELGKRKDKVILLTGAASGLPYKVVHAAHKNGSTVYGYSPVCSLKDQKKLTPEQDLSIYKKLFFIPSNFPLKDDLKVCQKYRNVISTASCDAGIIISGRWGTANEFTNLFDIGKLIGVLTGTGVFADELRALMKKITKKSKAVVLFDAEPKRLIKKILKELSKK